MNILSSLEIKSNTFNINRNTFDPLGKEVVNYINYELNYFNVISKKKDSLYDIVMKQRN
jgi:hypothetical protein